MKRKVKKNLISLKTIVVIICILIFSCFCSSEFALAGLVTFQKEYTYQASEADSKLSCRTIFLEQVKRLLLEELGAYLESETEVKNLQLTKDQITVLTAGIVRAEIIDERWDGKKYYLKAKITADPRDVAKSIEKLRQDRQKMKELEETRKKAAEALKEVEKLKKELEKAKAGKAEQEQYKNAVNRLSARDWFEKGIALYFVGTPQEIMEAFTRAIELNPKDAMAYYNRCVSYGKLGDYRQAIRDYNRAIELNPKYASAFYNRGKAYADLGDSRQAIRDLKTAARMGSKAAQDALRSIGVEW
ncbi:MAG: tetratricopeptide repeat protein [Deltaproteobacteria bacterium]|nr:tetratricopeptide repeat protein [Deltaproteobacteria bacterium]